MTKKSDTVTFRIVGIIHGIACAPRSMTGRQVADAVNAQYPSGTELGWSIKRRKLEDGSYTPSPCLDDPKRRHWWVEC